ncbi:MAG: EAL domain-containing protein [Pseudomonadota bacterium]
MTLRLILNLLVICGLASAIAADGLAAGVESASSDASASEVSASLLVPIALSELWLVIATALVLSMQAGFLLLEAGFVRSKNAINVAQKNLSDFTFASVTFLLIGSGVMFGPSLGGWLGQLDGSLFPTFDDQTVKLAFQLAFCGTAATIISGAVAERMSFHGYLACAVFTSAVIYPVSGHWIWGQTFLPGNEAFLADRGFIDYAGSTAVHALGAWVALAAVVIIGPRSGRFDQDGNPIPISGHSAVLSTTGVAILLVGWIGFNAGAATPGSAEFGRIVLNTIIAAASGGVASILIGRWIDGSHIPQNAINGIIGGLSAITASCFAVSLPSAAVIGGIGGSLAILGALWLLIRWRIDDAVGVVAAHGFAGAWGTLAVALFVFEDQLAVGSRIEQLVVQLEGVALVFVWAIGVSTLFFNLLNRVLPLRVTAEQEALGLNMVEHCSTLGTGHLKRALDALATQGGGLTSSRLDQDTGDEASELAETLNHLLDRQAGIERRLRANKERFQDFAETASDWLWETDSSLAISYLSDPSGNLLGFGADTLVGRGFCEIFEETSNAPLSLGTILQRRQDFRDVTCLICHAGNETIHVQLSGRPRFDDAGAFVGYRGTAADITQRLQSDMKIRYLAEHDSLTGLTNRSCFQSGLEQILEQPGSDERRLAVMLLDLDDFKGINDTYGHETGDHVLIVVAQRLLSVTRECDNVARLGGDEFAIIVPFDDRSAIDGLCRRIIDEIGKPIRFKGETLRSATSIGVSICPDDGADSETLLRNADLALYEAKDAGRSTFAYFTASMFDAIVIRKTLERDLRQAIIDNRLELHYQPQVRLDDGAVVGFEALLRWPHPEKGLVPPDVFIPVAEHSGLIQPLGLIVLAKSASMAADWISTYDRQFKMSVNVSPIQFARSGLVEEISKIIAASKMPADRLEIEITESMLVQDTQHALNILSALSEIGVSIAVDDFGTGYSSLSYLKRFPLDRLKIDRSFIKDLETSTNDQQITKAIIQLGHSLGLSVIAEGVETIFQRDYLRALGCNEAQGFLYSPARPANDLNQCLKTGRIGTEEEGVPKFSRTAEPEHKVHEPAEL